MSGLGPLRLVAKGSTGLHSVEAGAKSAAELEAAPEERSVGDGRGRIPEIGKNCPAVPCTMNRYEQFCWEPIVPGHLRKVAARL